MFWTLLVLILLETILGIDNIIFISLAVDKVSQSLRKPACIIGLGIALIMRFIVLFCTSYILSMQKPIFHILSFNISLKDLLMITGGFFLAYKSFIELLNEIFLRKQDKRILNVKSQFFLILLQIILIDLVFSIDSILTAIALTRDTLVITVAFTLSILEMLFLSSYVAELIRSYPGLKVITILFILCVGIYLMLDGIHIELEKEYLYFALAFALIIEVINSIKRRSLRT